MADLQSKLEESSENDIKEKKKVKKDSKKKKKSKKSKKAKKSEKTEKVQIDDVPSQEEVVVQTSDEMTSSTAEEISADVEHEPVEDESRDDHFDEMDEEQHFDKTSGDERKIFLSRIPAAFDEKSITSTLNGALGADAVESVSLSEAKNEDNDRIENPDPPTLYPHPHPNGEVKEHRGFAFVTMTSVEMRDKAVEQGTIKGKVKETSKRKYTLYVRPIVRNDGIGGMCMQADNAESDICFLWSKFRCPYGTDCKFKHSGEGACIEKKEAVGDKRSLQKCFAFRTKGKCKLGDECPYSHDFEPNKTDKFVKLDKKDKDCINWKTKGKCWKKDKCPYRHDASVRQAFLDKKAKKEGSKKRGRGEKVSQPLSIRVFGLNYDTKEEDVREYFKHCGKISEITFPTYEDSGRSKGYCGVLFVSPKATQKACELDGQELQGRWLSVQPGKMYLRQWEQREEIRKQGGTEEVDIVEKDVGEFGQKVKKRKKHGFNAN